MGNVCDCSEVIQVVHLSFRNVRSSGLWISALNEWLWCRHVEKQLALHTKGKLQRSLGAFLIPAKWKIPFDLKVTLHDDQIETSCSLTHVNRHTLVSNVSMKIRESNEITYTHMHIYTPQPASSLLTHGGLLVWSLWSPCQCQCYFLHPSERRPGFFSPEAGDTFRLEFYLPTDTHCCSQ